MTVPATPPAPRTVARHLLRILALTLGVAAGLFVLAYLAFAFLFTVGV